MKMKEGMPEGVKCSECPKGNPKASMEQMKESCKKMEGMKK